MIDRLPNWRDRIARAHDATDGMVTQILDHADDRAGNQCAAGLGFGGCKAFIYARNIAFDLGALLVQGALEAGPRLGLGADHFLACLAYPRYGPLGNERPNTWSPAGTRCTGNR